MSGLSDVDIHCALASGALEITMPEWLGGQPRVGPSSIDLHLGKRYRMQRRSLPGEGAHRPGPDLWGPEREISYSLVVRPGDYILASVAERIALDAQHDAQLSSRSTWRRAGLSICGDAGYVDPGFDGELVLELMVTGTKALLLYPGDRICQMSVRRLLSPAAHPYGKKGHHYQGQTGATACVAVAAPEGRT